MSVTKRQFVQRIRGRFALGLAAVITLSTVAAADPPRDPDSLVTAIRQAIETRDYDQFKELIFWKDVGEIKRRIVRFQINRGLGRPIRTITFEDFPEDGLKKLEATGKLKANMSITNKVRVVYDEPPLTVSGKPPTSVFLIGKVDDAYRIGLVVRKPGQFDDDDD